MKLLIQGLQHGAETIDYQWFSQFPQQYSEEIIHIIREVSAKDPIVGFPQTFSRQQAERYLADLQENMVKGKYHLLLIFNEKGAIVALATLIVNQNPNNKHLCDIAKGMILPGYRGGQLLPGAFLAIADHALEIGADLLTLDVRAGTHAAQVWRAWGFEVYGTLEDYARADGVKHTGLYMKQYAQSLKDRSQRKLDLPAK